MKKSFLFALVAMLLVGFSSTSFAQIKLGVSAGLAMPMGTFGDAYNMGFGATIDARYFTAENVAFGLHSGYLTMSDKLDYSETLGTATVSIEGKYSIIPILATGEYYFANEGFRPYLGAGIGFYMLSEKATTTISGDLPDIYKPYISDGSVTVSYTKLGIAPSAGFLYGISDKLDLNVNLKYNIIFFGSGDEEDVDLKSTDSESSSSMSFLGINVGLVFAL